MTPIKEIKVLDHGILALVSFSGNDFTPATAARTSYRDDSDKFSDEQNLRLIRYLITHRHTTPLEFCEATFYMVMPIFVARQWVRHRTASINEESLRYVEARNEFYIPDDSRLQQQSKDNKQGSSPEVVANQPCVRRIIEKSSRNSYKDYEDLLACGLAKELARMVLPLNTYTAWYWKCDLHNIFHLLSLRLDPHAQWEIQQYAQAMLECLRIAFPNIVRIWDDLRNGGI